MHEGNAKAEASVPFRASDRLLVPNPISRWPVPAYRLGEDTSKGRLGDHTSRTGCPSRPILRAMTKPVLRSLRWFAVALIVTVLGLAGWQFLIVGPGDPRDLRYQAWKLGVYPLRIDDALDTMIEDPHRDSIVIGKTKEQ